MTKNERFYFRLTSEDRQLLKALSTHLMRSESGTVRFLIKDTAQKLGVPQGQAQSREQEKKKLPVAGSFERMILR